MSRKLRPRRAISSQLPSLGSTSSYETIEKPRSEEDGKNGRTWTIVTRPRKKMKAKSKSVRSGVRPSETTRSPYVMRTASFSVKRRRGSNDASASRIRGVE